MAFAIGQWFHSPHCLWFVFFNLLVKTNWVRNKAGCESIGEWNRGCVSDRVVWSLLWDVASEVRAWDKSLLHAILWMLFYIFMNPDGFIEEETFRREKSILENFSLNQVTKMRRLQKDTEVFVKIDSSSPFPFIKYSMS